MANAIRDLMGTTLAQVEADASPIDAARCMRDADVGDVLVMQDGKLRGIVTDRDLVVRCMAEASGNEVTVGELCSADLVTVSPDDDIDKAVKLLSERAIRRLPVVENGKPVGILSIGDLAIERDSDSALADISAARPNQ